MHSSKDAPFISIHEETEIFEPKDSSSKLHALSCYPTQFLHPAHRKEQRKEQDLISPQRMPSKTGHLRVQNPQLCGDWGGGSKEGSAEISLQTNRRDRH